jgi:hypothetical protein
VVVHEGEEAPRLSVVDLGYRIEHQGFIVLCAGGCVDGGGVFREAATSQQRLLRRNCFPLR